MRDAIGAGRGVRRMFLLLVVAAGLGAAGCGADFLNPGGVTAVEGRITLDPSVDPERTPVFSVGVGVTYGVEAAAPGVLPLAQGAGIVLDPPWPNPLTASGTVRVRADSATTGRIEIWSKGAPFPISLSVLHAGAIPAGASTWTWDGTEFGTNDRVPNGLYYVRVTIPENPPSGTEPTRIELPWIVNRSVLESLTLSAFNATTDPDGYYQIADLAVEEPFARTSATGESLGAARLTRRLSLFTDDRDFRHFETFVTVAPREIVTVDISLIPTGPLAPSPVVSITGLPEP